MKSVIICEGTTDLTLIQYYMEKAYKWGYRSTNRDLYGFKLYRTFAKNDNELVIGEVGGCGGILNCLRNVLERNTLSESLDEVHDNVVVICDRDEADAVVGFDSGINECMTELALVCPPEIVNNSWAQCSVVNARGKSVSFRFLLLVLPFEETGALETFLLSAISEKDSYDGYIIKMGNGFVDTVDYENRYLLHRRHKTKAKFDVYFSIRTPYEQFGQRRDILRSIDWENYELLQNSFKKLEELG